MDALLNFADPLVGIVGFGILFLVPAGLYICIKTKRGRRFLGLENN